MLYLLLGLMAVQTPVVPDPFEAFDEEILDTSHTPGVVVADTPRIQMKVGGWSVGGGVASSLGYTYNERVSGEGAQSNTLFLRSGVDVGYLIHKNWRLTAGTGFFVRNLASDDAGNVLNSGLELKLGGEYLRPISERFMLFAGGSLGGYYGGSTRDSKVEGEEVDERTTSFGASLSAQGGASYRIIRNLDLRAQVDAVGLIGTESVPSADQRLFSTTLNAAFGLGLVYWF